MSRILAMYRRLFERSISERVLCGLFIAVLIVQLIPLIWIAP